MLFRAEPRFERYVDTLPPNAIPRLRRENHANRLTAAAFNALAIGIISSTYFLPSADSTSVYEAKGDIVDSVDGAVSTIILTITGHTNGGCTMADASGCIPGFIAPALPFIFIFFAIGLHFIARGFANRQ